AERASDRRRAFLSGAIHALLRQVCETGLWRRLPRRHRSGGASAGSRRRRDRVRADEIVPGKSRRDAGRVIVRIGGWAGAHSGGRGSSGDRGLLERGRSPMAPAAREISLVLTLPVLGAGCNVLG